MKNFTLLSLILAFSFSMFAQTRANMPKMERNFVKEDVSIQMVRFDKYEDYQNELRAYGDTISYEDFGSGGPGVNDLPTNWTSVDYDSQGNNYTWQFTTVGATGPTTSGYEHVLASTTAANGWMILDSDNYGQGSYDSYLYSPSYNCFGYEAVAIAFEELYQRWGNEAANPYGGNPTYVGVSIDGGITWTEIEIHAAFDIKESTDNPGYFLLNISSIAGNQMDVKLYFRMKGLWDYWWQIDDLLVIEGAHNDLKIVDTFTLSAEEAGGGGYYFYGYYSQMPMAQLTPWYFQANVTNNGIDLQHNVSLQCEITESGTTVYSQTDDTLQLDFLDSTSLSPALFTATGPGHYYLDYYVDQTEIEEYPDDNGAGPFDWKITDNKIMARDYTYSRGLSPSMYTGGADGDLLGVDYHITNDDTAKSISVFIDWRTDLGTTIIGQIYEGSSGSWAVQIESEEHEIVAEDLGTWITLPLTTIDPDDDKLNAGETYMVGIEFYWGNDPEVNLWIGAEDEGPHTYYLVTNLRIGSDWYWISDMPMIRLNLGNAVTPPEFAKAGGSEFYPAYLEICASSTQNVSYEVDFEVIDPNGLPVTIDTVNVPDFVSDFVDQGNGNYTLAFDLEPTDISETITYNFEIIADNGISQNILYFWANVLEVAGCEPWAISDNAELNLVNIYPNPSTGILNIENAGNATIYVYNIIGEEITSVKADSAIETIDLSDLSEGTYIVKVVTENNVVSQQINLIK